MKTAFGIAPLVAVLFLGATEVEAQRWDRHGERPVRSEIGGWIGFNLLGADPVGEFGRRVDDGFGVALEGRLPLDREGVISLRADAGFLRYGNEEQTFCFEPFGCRIGVELETSNEILFVGVGPELGASRGALRPYVNATAGFSYFATTSRLRGTDEFESFADTRNHDDLVPAFTVGGGLRARLRGGRSPILLDLGARYHRNGEAEYLREGDIVDHPDGSITIFPNRSDANLVTVRIGVSVGIPRGGDDDRRDRRRRR